MSQSKPLPKPTKPSSTQPKTQFAKKAYVFLFFLRFFESLMDFAFISFAIIATMKPKMRAKFVPSANKTTNLMRTLITPN